MCSGSNATKTMQLFHHMNLQMFSTRTYNRLQALYIIPLVQLTWDSEQTDLLQQMRGQEVVVGGDARCDSPGYCAKYGSYTIMDLDRKKVLDTQLVQCNEVKSSSHMELEGLKRAIAFLERQVRIKTLVTDRHCMVKKFMKEHHNDINHYFDVWHVAKGLSRKLEAVAKKPRGEDVRPWIKSIVSHLYWSAASPDGTVKSAKWLSITSHICNKHTLDTEDFPACEHEILNEDREWLKAGSVPFKLIQQIVENKYLTRDIPQLSPVHQTYGLEVFHSLVNHFAPKNTHFFYPAMMARVCVAALHYNENSSREQAGTTDGQRRFSVAYPKSKKGSEAVVKPVKSPPTFAYMTLIKQMIIDRRMNECPSYAYDMDDIKVLNDHHPKSVSSTFQTFNKEMLIASHRSRFPALHS